MKTKCERFEICKELEEVAKEIEVSTECYLCGKCLFCADNVPVIGNYGAGMIAKKINETK